jgi:hypothetical protein
LQIGGTPLFPSIANTVYFLTTTVAGFDHLISCSKTPPGSSGSGGFMLWGTDGPTGTSPTMACPAGYNALFHGGMFQTANSAASSSSQMMCGVGATAAYGFLQWSGNASAPWNGSSFAVTNGCTFCVASTYTGCFQMWGTNTCPVVAGYNLQLAYAGVMIAPGYFGGSSSGEAVCSATAMAGVANKITFFAPGGNSYTTVSGTTCAVCCQ